MAPVEHFPASHKVGRRHEQKGHPLEEEREFHTVSCSMKKDNEEQANHPAQVKPAFPRRRSGNSPGTGGLFLFRLRVRRVFFNHGHFHSGKKKSEGAFAIRLYSPHAVMKTHRLIPVLPGSEQVQGISPEPASQVFLRQFFPQCWKGSHPLLELHAMV